MEITKQKEIQNQTIESMNGRWLFKNDESEIRLFISEKECSLIQFEGGIEASNIDFSGRGAWFGQHLIFTDKMKFYVRFADKESLIFGEYINNKDHNILWEKEFKRVVKF
mgnify:CR=1 FL=1